MSITRLYDERINNAMVNILSNKGFDRQWINGINVMSELEKLLNELVIKYTETSEERQMGRYYRQKYIRKDQWWLSLGTSR